MIEEGGVAAHSSSITAHAERCMQEIESSDMRMSASHFASPWMRSTVSATVSATMSVKDSGERSGSVVHTSHTAHTAQIYTLVSCGHSC